MPNPVAFTIANIDIRWYGILITFGMLLALGLSYRNAHRHQIDKECLLDLFLAIIPAGIIGARLYYVLFQWSYYSEHLNEIFLIRNGGLAIHGGLIFGVVAGYLVCRHKNIKTLEMTDLVFPNVALAQAIGRWGNYFNGEAHGGPTDLPWGIMVDGVKVHPTFLYESLWCLGLFVLLTFLDRKPHFSGQITCLYCILYSIERFLVEGLRTDSLMIGPFKQAQLLSVTVAVIGIIAFFALKKSAGEKGAARAQMLAEKNKKEKTR